MTSRTVAWTVGRTVAAALLILAVGGSLQISVGSGIFNPFNFFGYFTIQNNLIGAAALLIVAHYTGRERPAWVEYLRACAAVYLAIVVTVYWTLLAPNEETVLEWTNLIVHLTSGVVLLLDWLLEGPRKPLPWKSVWVLTLYPAVWLVVVLIRGAIDGWVPYEFLNPEHGYGAVSLVILAIVVAALAVGSLLFQLTRWRIITPREA